MTATAITTTAAPGTENPDGASVLAEAVTWGVVVLSAWVEVGVTGTGVREGVTLGWSGTGVAVAGGVTSSSSV